MYFFHHSAECPKVFNPQNQLHFLQKRWSLRFKTVKKLLAHFEFDPRQKSNRIRKTMLNIMHSYACRF